MTNQSLRLRSIRAVSGSSTEPSSGPVDASHAEIDNVERVERQVAEIVVNGVNEFLA